MINKTTTDNDNNYDNQIKEINDFFYIVLSQVVSILPKYNTYPDIKTYANEFSRSMNNLKEVETRIFLLKNDIEKNLSSMNKKTHQINNEIHSLEKNVSFLKKKLSSLNNSDNASIGMLKDTKMLHNQEYIGNLILIGIIISILIFFYQNYIKKKIK